MVNLRYWLTDVKKLAYDSEYGLLGLAIVLFF